MATHGDEELAIGMVYAASIYELAEQQDQVDAVREELGSLVGLARKNREIGEFLDNPTVEPEAKRRAIEKAFRGRCSDLVVDALQVMNRNERLSCFRAVVHALGVIDDERRGGIEVQVRAAAPLSDDLRRRIHDVIAKRSGRKPHFVETVDESLIGGLVLRIGDRRMDASVARQLAVLSEELLDRASEEIHSGREYVAS